MTLNFQERGATQSSSHVEFRDRVRKTLYYGQYSDRSLPSLAVTDVAVEVLGSVAPTDRKCLDTSYAMVVSRRAKISPCTLMMGILYSERLRQKNPEYLARVSSSDLFLISVMVASKYLYDEGEEEEVFNDDWARAGNKTVNDVNKLEMEFLASIDWSLFVSNQEFLDFVNKVESRIATTHGLCRGWFTYSDLCTLLDNTRFLGTLSLLRLEILKVFSACTLAYVFSLSLALSVTSFTSCHCHHSNNTSDNFTPPVQTPVCLTTESACRFHHPPEMPRRRTEVPLVVSKRFQMQHNHSETPVQQAMTIKTQQGLQGNECCSPLSCNWKPLEFVLNNAVQDSRNKVNVNELKTRKDSAEDLRLSSTLFTQILSQKLVLHNPCTSFRFMESYTSGLVQSNFVSNVTGALGHSDWLRSHAKSSFICVA